MNGWIKRFTDGTYEAGIDKDVEQKRASWSRGRLTEMTSVELYHDKHLLIIEGTGEFWQSDDYEIDLLESTPKLVKRRIQKKIKETDRFLMMSDKMPGYHYFSVQSSSMIRPTGTSCTVPIKEGTTGQWLTVEVDLLKSKVIFNFKESRI